MKTDMSRLRRAVSPPPLKQTLSFPIPLPILTTPRGEKDWKPSEYQRKTSIRLVFQTKDKIFSGSQGETQLLFLPIEMLGLCRQQERGSYEEGRRRRGGSVRGGGREREREREGDGESWLWCWGVLNFRSSTKKKKNNCFSLGVDLVTFFKYKKCKQGRRWLKLWYK